MPPRHVTGQRGRPERDRQDEHRDAENVDRGELRDTHPATSPDRGQIAARHHAGAPRREEGHHPCERRRQRAGEQQIAYDTGSFASILRRRFSEKRP